MKKLNEVYVDTTGLLTILIRQMKDDMKMEDVTDEVFENVPHDEDEVGEKYYKLQDISDYLTSKYSVNYKDKVFSPLIYVSDEKALYGTIYCFCNHGDGKWEERGTLRGYA